MSRLPSSDQPAESTAGLFDPAQYQMCDSVGYLMQRARNMLAHGVEQEVSSLDITQAQASCLMMLATGRASTVTDLGRELNTDMGSVTRLLSRMEKRGLIERRRRDADRRVVDLSVTPQGQELVERLPAIFCKVLAHHFRGFSEDEIQLLRSMLRRIIENNSG
ncbi:DNA-binding transcriptional regulator, MarR family [Cupriavidus necator]|uniref:MarR family transcriptional regulator n=1 Tax=Cupriavidus necator (strain ATCC 17699 / DSM 428 / KCTC 22496 / NCIMB 10442 / H16 / Stanier 337) TaxID=381666 RepID=Q0K9D0_CUPNH|nr:MULTISPECIES: MarR family winged helix-turn-helix transcriptional regulator [Cupriavidus]EON21327.1 MarR family transcriptional regulator [Cupriavidus sp. GA3-3]KUE88931.1 MarR family transcriptional regulator [Cupriavidus necator]QCC01194.1 MarR family transcriptional regulator [Cupriavidus necator H16]QQB75978.1 winged helix-turn-helix transcriptional regulator [Cupriavidus necator]WKA39579.1 MarR family winged helix-turn-helix transcriptional regulator [Cupriavidus necator]